MPPNDPLGSLSPGDGAEPLVLGPPPPVPTPLAPAPAPAPAGAPTPKPRPEGLAATPRKGVVTGGAPPPPRPANLGAPKPPGPPPPRPEGLASSHEAAGEGAVCFPLFEPPLASWKTGARWFGAPRGSGRHHAAVDLLAPHQSRIRAIADGVVVQAPYYFYSGTNALEVRHPGVGVVRYGEIDTRKVVKLKAGDPVRAGQVIAYVGRLDSGSSMLHFELYSGEARGALTVRGNPPYQRRRDLVDPTSLIDRLVRDVQSRR